jgi:D-sedoheptulose 7-phosphate isomerase
MVNQNHKELSRSEKTAKAYIKRVTLTLEKINLFPILELVNELMSVRRSGSTVFIAGNGGSASTASHISLDWMLGTNLVNPPLRVISLVDSTASITATGNDIAFLDIFSRPLRALAQEGDLLVVVSASGNSPNLVSLVETARDKGVRVAAITGFDGGRLAKAADLSIHVATEIGDYGVAEDIHLMIGHMVKEALLEER